MGDFFFYIFFLAISFLIVIPRSERSSILSLGRLGYGIGALIIIFLLLQQFSTIVLFDTFAQQGWQLQNQQSMFSQTLESTPLSDMLTLPPITAELALSFMVACFFTSSIFYTLLLSRPHVLVLTSTLYLGALVVVSIVFLLTPSLFTMFIAFECLLLTSLGLLKLTSKSERIGEAVSEMFMWTLFGSFFLLLGFFTAYAEVGNFLDHCDSTAGLFADPVSGLISFFFIIGFGVKIPVWPFISWLLKAHVEASVEFSILLSGFIVKLGILGLWRILDALAPDWIYLLIFFVSLMAICDATVRLFAQTDLKRIVALTTVIEMNWLNLCYLAGDINLVFLANFLIVVHCFTTTSEFLLVEFISKRYGTRDFWQISGLWYNTPVLWYYSFIVVFTTIGFPGTSIFMAKFIFLLNFIAYSYWIFSLFICIFFFILPLFFIRLWVPVWFGLPQQHKSGLIPVLDLTSRELTLLSSSCALGLLLGIFPTFFFDIF